ncbi:uncharacterized protein LOC126903683 [Daktulosphaira vitifoliae]|uniref:uncharacterized protein LOC126903683 n=1 Tax=Daktulosphaira vitifoliae TaxID=58002 RepID=UPI0021AAE3E8|nr:uncharacterized protein LOC126903683 [Daktulosphaira vitifoliae]
MHSFGLQSALAIRRQRKRRAELKRHMERRRLSSQSVESGIHDSRSTVTSPTEHNGSFTHSRRRRKKPPKMLDTKVASSIGMLHVGVVFLVLGLFLIGSGIVPDDYISWNPKNWLNELVITGVTSSIIGLFLIILNHFIYRKAEDDLAAYVERQLTRTRSGRRLVPDAETGAMQTKQQFKARQQGQISQTNSPGSDLGQIAEEEATCSAYKPINQYDDSTERLNSDRLNNKHDRELTRCYDTTET